MRKFLVLAATWLVLCSGVVVAQQVLPGFPPGAFSNKAALDPASGGGGYTGPGDVVSGAIAWWGLRCYNTAYTGNVADIWDSATGSTTETLLTCSSGGTINQTVHTLATTCAVACRVATLYDQSGHSRNVTQATNANRPTLTLNCSGTLPCMTGTSTSQLASTTVTQAQPYTVAAVAESIGLGAAADADVFFNANLPQLYWENSGGLYIKIYAGSPSFGAAATDSTLYSLAAVFSGASSGVSVNGVTTSSSTGTGGLSGLDYVFDTVNNANPGGEIMEVGEWSGAFNSTQITNMCHNQRLYWNTSGSC